MNQLVERSPKRWPAKLLGRLAASAAEVPTREQSAVQRARVDTSAWARRAPIRFGLLTTGAVAGAGVIGAVVASPLAVVAQVGVAIGAACFGFVVTVSVLFAIEWVMALRRQRDEARDELKRLTQPVDLAGLSRNFSNWVAAKRAALPQHGLRIMPQIPDIGSEVWLNHEKRQDEIDRIQARARSEYHERFRASVAGALGEDAEEPTDIAALEELAEKLRAAVAEDERAKRIADAVGQPVGPNQRALLDGLLTRVHLAVANHNAVDYDDAPDGEPHNRDLFAAHFPALIPQLDTWHAAVEGRETAVRSLRDWIPQEVQRRGFIEPHYFNGTMAACFSEVTVGRARRQELDDPFTVRIRCVQDVAADDGEKGWSAYVHSGREEVKVAELSHELKEFTEEGTAELNKIIAAMEQDLQACFDALQRSDAAPQVADAQSALNDLRQPLLDRLKLIRNTANPVFSDTCRYCLAEIGL
jgi:hypothetical protein